LKKQILLPCLFAALVILLTSCNSNPSADQYLKEDNHRKDIFQAIINNQPYMTEMMKEMLNSDNCKQMMMNGMMNDLNMREMHLDKMMIMCKDDSSLCKMMMGKTMGICDTDSVKCKMMMGSMQSHPNVMKSMRGMYNMGKMK